MLHAAFLQISYNYGPYAPVGKVSKTIKDLE